MLDRYLIVALYLAILILLSVLPAGAWPIRAVPQAWQKRLHAVAYAALGLLLVWVWQPNGSPPSRVAMGAFLVAAAFGAAMESLQRLLPTRTASLVDIGRNAVGAATGVILAALWYFD